MGTFSYYAHGDINLLEKYFLKKLNIENADNS